MIVVCAAEQFVSQSRATASHDAARRVLTLPQHRVTQHMYIMRKVDMEHRVEYHTDLSPTIRPDGVHVCGQVELLFRLVVLPCAALQ